MAAAQQTCVLERDGQRQNAVDARQYSSVPVLSGKARTPARAESHHPAHAERGIEPAAFARVRNRLGSRPNSSTRMGAGCSPGRQWRFSTSTSSRTRWATRPSPSMHLRGTISSWWMKVTAELPAAKKARGCVFAMRYARRASLSSIRQHSARRLKGTRTLTDTVRQEHSVRLFIPLLLRRRFWQGLSDT